MHIQVTGCSYRASDVALRERLAFSPTQIPEAALQLRKTYPNTEVVLLSTCNRVELYLACHTAGELPDCGKVARFLADYHALDHTAVQEQLFHYADQEAVQHLFTVACSLDSMIVGEAQILSQVKQAFNTAQEAAVVGPLFQQLFQSANHVAKRVAAETAIHRKRVSVPSVAVTEYAKRLFETFENKRVLVIGAGEMAEETLHYLIDEGAQDIVIVNRTAARAEELAARVSGRVAPWHQLLSLVAESDLVVSTTGAPHFIVTLDDFRSLEQQRADRLQFILDLAVPRDFEPAIDQFANVYLYCVDDLQAVCDRNRKARKKEWPKAQHIIDDETKQFLNSIKQRGNVPVIRRFRQQANEIKQTELQRLFQKIPETDTHQRKEITLAFDRVVNKLLHPPMESLRAETEADSGKELLDALRRLFQIDD